MGFYNCKLSLCLSISSLILFSLPDISVFGQSAPAQPVKIAENQITTDENIELNIIQERIIETNFARSTNVQLQDTRSGDLRIEVGVGVRADSIDVILRGIFGRARFRASLESLRQRIERLQMTETQNVKAPIR